MLPMLEHSEACKVWSCRSLSETLHRQMLGLGVKFVLPCDVEFSSRFDLVFFPFFCVHLVPLYCFLSVCCPHGANSRVQHVSMSFELQDMPANFVTGCRQQNLCHLLSHSMMTWLLASNMVARMCLSMTNGAIVVQYMQGCVRRTECQQRKPWT